MKQTHCNHYQSPLRESSASHPVKKCRSTSGSQQVLGAPMIDCCAGLFISFWGWLVVYLFFAPPAPWHSVFVHCNVALKLSGGQDRERNEEKKDAGGESGNPVDAKVGGKKRGNPC